MKSAGEGFPFQLNGKSLLPWSCWLEARQPSRDHEDKGHMLRKERVGHGGACRYRSSGQTPMS